MIYSVNFKRLANQVEPLSFVKFLKDNGWTQFMTKKEYLKIFQKKIGDEAYQVNIPLDPYLADYNRAMYNAVETVAIAEKQDIEKVLLWLLNPDADILKVRIQHDNIKAGNIFFDDAIKVYENVKKLLTAAAQDVVEPKRYHRGRVADSILQFINNCKFGQTEVGSYIVPIICPFAELDEFGEYRELSLFNEDRWNASLTRKVTNKIMNNISVIKFKLDNGEYSGLLERQNEEIISANFYEALADMNLKNSQMEFIAQWSPAVKPDRTIVSRVELSSQYYEPIRKIIDELKPSAKRSMKIIGRIKSLSSSPDAQKRESGRISVVYLDNQDKKKTLSLTLNKEDYDKALKAHRLGSYVEIFGKFSNDRRNKTVFQYESFSIME